MGNPLLDAKSDVLHSESHDPQSRWIITGSGSLAPEPYEAEPRNWMGQGRAALDRLVEQTSVEIAGSSLRWLVMPHCRDVLSDVQGVRRFLLDHADAPVGVALNPSALFERGMLRHVEDHLTRIIGGLGPACSLILLQDIAPPITNLAEAQLVLCAPGKGLLPWDLMTELLRRYVPSDTPIVLRAEDAPAGAVENAVHVARGLELI